MQLEHRLSALLQLHLHSRLNTWFQWIGKNNCKTRQYHFRFGIWWPYIRDFTIYYGNFPQPPGKYHQNSHNRHPITPMQWYAIIHFDSWFLNGPYNAVQHDKVLHISLQWQRYEKIETMNSQRTSNFAVTGKLYCSLPCEFSRKCAVLKRNCLVFWLVIILPIPVISSHMDLFLLTSTNFNQIMYK